MRMLHSDAVDYLEEIPLEHWARCKFPYPRFGHDTSNIAESLNAAISDFRNLPPVQMIGALWTYIMEQRFERRHRPKRGQLANEPLKLFEERAQTAARFKVYRLGSGVFQVEDLKGDNWVVELDFPDAVSCECGWYDEYSAECTHMIIAALTDGQDPYGFVSNRYTTECYRLTYEEPLYLLNIGNLTPDLTVKPSKHVNQSGRPTTKRLRNKAPAKLW